jgi:hypothetical protein
MGQYAITHQNDLAFKRNSFLLMSGVRLYIVFHDQND